MDPRTQERVEQWDSRPFTGGNDGLGDLADEGFSGVVTTGDVWLFVLNGRAVGIDGGDLEDVESASGTAYVAPDPAPPLLAAMKTRGGETRAKYYTNKTPLSDVDETLQDGSFTGYVELSEQVLSGDYYLVYYGGRRMAAAYIGNAERLLTGEEAFERAADEVGIYEVVDVDVDVIDLVAVVDDEADEATAESEPEAETSADETDNVDEPTAVDATPTEEATTVSAAERIASSGGPSNAPAPAIEGDDHTDDRRNESVAVEDTSDDLPSPETVTVTEAETTADEPATPDVDEERDESTAEYDESTQPEVGDESQRTADQPERSTTHRDPLAEPDPTASFSEHAADSIETTEPENLDERFKQEERWRETRRIPSIEPENTSESVTRSDRRSSVNRGSEPKAADTSSVSSTAGERAELTSPLSDADARSSASNQATKSQSSARDTDPATDRVETLREQRDTLKEKLENLEDERDALANRRAELEDERDTLRAETRELSATVDRLEQRVEELEAQLERARSVDATGAVTDTTEATSQISASRALDGTNLFVRYGSKGKATLEKAHAGEAGPEQVSSNLRLEHHTDFDASETAVDGRPYDQFLPSTLEYQFVDWLVDTLLYEIRDTGRTSGLADLYDVIPEIDRIEFSATVSLADDDTEEVPEEVDFDVVVFDKMGRPLVVANLNDSREPATREMLERLENAASAVKANYPELAAAAAVTSSFFQPGALEVTEIATSGGLLSRSSKLNYVNVSRKQGYHLCLVEARSGGFHMTVPEL